MVLSMDISENALELLRIVYAENVKIDDLQRRTKWVRKVLDEAVQELVEKKCMTEEGKVTNEGSEMLKRYGVQKNDFNVNMNAFNTKWG